jgi:hypothetical protein
MRQLAFAVILALTCNGCGAAVLGALLLSEDGVDGLTENFEETIETHQKLAEFATKAARGELDISEYDYDPPTVENGMTGTLSMPNGDLPFGQGLVEIVFQVDGDGAAVDPYATDLSGMGTVDGNVQVMFRGLSPKGKALDIDADVDVSTITNDITEVTALLAGDWNIDLDGYGTRLSSDGVELDIDLVTDEVTSALGSMDGEIDIPNFPIDGDFDVEGLGDKLEVGIDVAVTEINFLVDLVDIF